MPILSDFTDDIYSANKQIFQEKLFVELTNNTKKKLQKGKCLNVGQINRMKGRNNIAV